jgi:hypothetical protein
MVSEACLNLLTFPISPFQLLYLIISAPAEIHRLSHPLRRKPESSVIPVHSVAKRNLEVGQRSLHRNMNGDGIQGMVQLLS